MRVFVAGASGALGRYLVPQLVQAGHVVVGSARTREKFRVIQAGGATAVQLEGLDEDSVITTIQQVKPEVIIHQMTLLAGASDVRRFDQGFEVSNRLRTVGLAYLVEAGRRVGVRRFIAQSFCGWPYKRDGNLVKDESAPLDDRVAPQAERTLAAIRYLENKMRTEPDIEGIALRYGGFYAPDTGVFDPMFLNQIRKRMAPVVGSGAGMWSFIHLADAAAATVAFVAEGAPGIYNVVDDNPVAVREWLPGLAQMIDAKPPLHVPRWIGRLAAGEHAVNMMTSVRAGSNAKIKSEVKWTPRYGSWRQGFPDALAGH